MSDNDNADPIVFDGLTRYYGAKRALDSLTLSVPQGSVYALLGRNGAGKSTAIACLMGMLQPTRGMVRVLGHEAGSMPAAMRERIGYVAEGQRTVPWMKIEQLVRFQRATFPSFDLELCNGYLSRLGLSQKQKVKTLSRGQQAQVALALALAPRPELVVLDDPALGLDAVVRREFLEVMIDLIQEEGRTLLFTSHILTDVERVADHVAIIVDGVLRVRGPLEDVKDRVQHLRASFDDRAPRVPALPGLVRAVKRRGDMLVTVTRDADGAERALRELGATQVDRHRLSLEDLFVEYTTSVSDAPAMAESATAESATAESAMAESAMTDSAPSGGE